MADIGGEFQRNQKFTRGILDYALSSMYLLQEGLEGGVCISNHGLNFLIFTIHVDFWSHFHVRVYVGNGFKTIHVHTVFFVDAELLCQ